jgi:succinate dehydrogenase/fumarate reductase flavoprotein subunit
MRALDAQIQALKRELATLPDLRPGTLTRQYNVCGSPGCRCKAAPPHKHGPYYHLSYTRHGKGGTRLIQKEDLAAIRAAVANYARLRRLVDHWIDLATELSDLKLAQRTAAGTTAKRR